MIIAGHYKRTGAHIFSSISSSGQSLMVLTGEECRLCEQCVCVRKRQKGSTVSGQHGLFQISMLNSLLCLGMSRWVMLSLCERKSRAEISISPPAAACAIQSVQGSRISANWNCMMPRFGSAAPGRTGYQGHAFWQTEKHFTGREKGDPWSAEDSSWYEDEQWSSVRARAENWKNNGKAVLHLLKRELSIK